MSLPNSDIYPGKQQRNADSRAGCNIIFSFLFWMATASILWIWIQLKLKNMNCFLRCPIKFKRIQRAAHGSDYFKLGFDEECFSRLPRQFPFLLNPLNQQKISFLPAAAIRLKAIFEILLGLLSTADTDPDLILAHLNSLLTEINTAYFAAHRKPAHDRIEKFIGFKVFVENNLTDHPTITNIAEELAVSTDSLYQIVKHFSGLSPKEFITNRLILEARRRLHVQ